MPEPIAINEYSSPRAFSIFDAFWGSNAFVLHNHGGMFVGDGIDLVFLSAEYVDLPFEVAGLRVSQPCDQRAAQYQREFGVPRKLEQPLGQRVFVIESEGKRFHVIGSTMWVLIRTPGSDRSLQPLFSDDLIEREAFIAQNIKEWYRMTSLSD